MRTLLFIFITSLGFAATVPASSTSRTDVENAYNSAADLDVITIPPGESTWATPIVVTKAVTFQGAGSGNNPATDTIITSSTTSESFTVTLVADKTTRFTAMRFKQGRRAMGITGSEADNRRLRIDHCFFKDVGSAAYTNGDGAVSPLALFNVFGVIDNCTFEKVDQLTAAYVYNSGWGGSSYGDGSYAAADYFGTDKFIFFEDCTFTNTTTGFSVTAIDGFAGSRYVVRYSTANDCHFDWHGTESGGRNRGGRAGEFYWNTFNDTFGAGTSIIYIRSGVVLAHNNTATGSWNGTPVFRLLNFRNDAPYGPFSSGNAESAGADGRNPWDVNLASGPFLTGSVTGADSGDSVTRTVTVTGGGLTPSAWVGYAMHRTSGKSVSSLTRSGTTVTAACTAHGFSTGQRVSIRGASIDAYNDAVAYVTVTDVDTFTYELPFGSGTPANPTGTIYAMRGSYFAEITANDTTTITFKACEQGAEYFMRFVASDTFSLWKVTHAMDQPGRMGGSLVSGDAPTRPGGWNDQTTSACYEWSNTGPSSSNINWAAAAASIVENTHFINDTAKPGYSAYTYPHPLISGETSTPTNRANPGRGTIMRRR
jgi:hypothetical protein